MHCLKESRNKERLVLSSCMKKKQLGEFNAFLLWKNNNTLFITDYIYKLNYFLTTASQSGGWVPETSRSFHYWQPAPRWRPLPWLANPGNPAMSSHTEGEKQAPVSLIKQWKEREGQGRETASEESPHPGKH